MLSSWSTFQLAFLLSPTASLARDIVFPSIDPLQLNLASPRNPSQDEISEADMYAGLTTFANLPWRHCLSPEDHIEKYDIAFLGAPFDTATTGRPGTRYGPTGIRL